MRTRRFWRVFRFSWPPTGFFLGGMLVLVFSCPLRGEEGDPLRDVRLTVRARQAVQREPLLAALGTVHVSVRANVATLWGTVPSAALARLAEEQLRQVQEIFEVRNELEVQSPHDPLREFLRSAAPRTGQGTERLWFLANRPPVHLTSRPEDDVPAEDAPRPAVSLLPPISAPALTSGAQGLVEAVTRLQRTDLRFQTIQVEVQGGVVRLRAAGTRSESVFEFAHAVSRLPGVERVVLHD